MRRYLDWAILITLILSLVACASLGEFFVGLGETMQDDQVQQSAGGLVRNIVSGNWVGAVESAVELGLASATAYKATMMRRDGLRRKRGEATGKASDGPAQ